jgi:hypothetical protein
MKAPLAVRALRNAIDLRDPQGTIVRSDKGSQPEFDQFRDADRVGVTIRSPTG